MLKSAFILTKTLALIGDINDDDYAGAVEMLSDITMFRMSSISPTLRRQAFMQYQRLKRPYQNTPRTAKSISLLNIESKAQQDNGIKY